MHLSYLRSRLYPHRLSLSLLLILVIVLPIVGSALAAPGTTDRVSVDSAGNQANFGNDEPTMSADGRFVAFLSDATNLVSGDTNSGDDIYLRDRQTSTTTRISLSNQAGTGSRDPAISADGRFVAFTSGSTNLVAGDTNNADDIFVHDMQTGATTRVSVDSTGNQANSPSDSPAISGNSRFIAFYSNATNLVSGDTNGVTDVFVHDMQTGITTRASVDSTGNQGNGQSLTHRFNISADGRFVAFESDATNLVSGDTNNQTDVFVHDMQTGITTRASVDSAGTEGNNLSYFPVISADGHVVAFTSAASNFVPSDTNNAGDIFVHDTQSGTTTRVSIDSAGNQGSGPAESFTENAAISADGHLIAFQSDFFNLVPSDTNNVSDIFVHELSYSISGRVTDSHSGTQQIVVDARVQWQNTGIVVQTDDQIQVTYLSGAWKISGADQYTDANGQIGRRDSCTLLPTANTGGLVGRIGTDAPLFIGNTASLSAQSNGTLQLSINDCGQFGDNDGTLTLQITVTRPILGVTISDGAGHTSSTDSNGNYILSGLAAGTYTLTPSKTGYSFSPSSRTISVPPDATGQDFVGTTSSISGRVTIGSDVSQQVAVDARIAWQDTGITIQSGDHIQVTYISGTWRISGADPYTDANGQVGRTETCTVLPTAYIGGLIGRIGTATPQFIGNTASFIAQSSGTLQLSINDCAQFDDNDGILTVQVTISHPLSGVTISAGAGHTAITDNNGSYTLSGLQPGSYTLIPSKAGYSFSPSSRTVSVPPDAIGQDFVAAPAPSTFSISGRVIDNNAAPIPGVMVSDGAGHTTTTGDDGTYTLIGLQPGTYTLTPSKSSYVFRPATLTINLTTNITEANFQALIQLRQISKDPYKQTNVQHRTEVEPDTLSFGSTIISAFMVGELKDGNGAANIGWATSKNGGTSWTSKFLTGITTFEGGIYDRVVDPSVAYDANHNVWLISSLAATFTPSVTYVVFVSRSSDGLTWSKRPVGIATGGFLDKPWIVCDNSPTSNFYGHCYAHWIDANNHNQLHMSTSSNGGLTWTEATVPSANVNVVGGQPLVQPNGNIVVPTSTSDVSAIESFVSTDGGATYTGPFKIADINEHEVAGNLRTEPIPSAEMDASGNVYVVWQDCGFHIDCAANDIVMSTSTDGQTWSAVKRIPIDPVGSNVDHFIPGLGVDKTTSGSSAHLGLTFYYYPSANCTASTCKLNVGFVSSVNGGMSWMPKTYLAGPMTLSWLANKNMVGDYISTSILNGKAYPVFAVANKPSNTGVLDEAMYTPKDGLDITGGNVTAP